MILESERLILRNFKESDLDILYDYRNNIKCYKYQSWKNKSKEYLKKFIDKNKEKVISKDIKELQLAIAFKSSEELVGDMYIAFKDKTITLGYTISYKHHRKGYAYEIIKATINFLFNQFKNYEIVCLVHPDNEPSTKLLEKLNFKREEYIEKINSLIYSLSYLN